MKLNFYSRVYLAITDFRLYPYVVQKEKFVTAFGYFLSFMILVAIILSANATVRVVNWLDNFAVDYMAQVSDYSIKDGEFSTRKNMDIDFQGVRIFTDDSKSVSDINLDMNDLNKHKLILLAYKDSLVIANKNVGFINLKYSDYDINIDKITLYKGLATALNSVVFKLSLAGIIFCGVFVAYFLTKFFNVIGITLMLLFLGLVFRTKYKFSEYMKAAFYVITLPIITEIIAFIIVGELNEYANITYYLLSYVYMFYAIRALKLDNIIISTQEKILNMKSESEQANEILNTEKKKQEEKKEDEAKHENEKQSEKDVEESNVSQKEEDIDEHNVPQKDEKENDDNNEKKDE